MGFELFEITLPVALVIMSWIAARAARAEDKAEGIATDAIGRQIEAVKKEFAIQRELNRNQLESFSHELMSLDQKLTQTTKAANLAAIATGFNPEKLYD